MSEEHTTIVKVGAVIPQGGGSASAYLIVVHSRIPAMLGRMIKVDSDDFVVGRSSEASFQIEDDGVSRKHAKVVRGSDGAFYLMDLGSTNGTFLNGDKIEGTHPLRDGDKMQLGSKLVLKFSLQDKLDEEYQRSIYDSATLDSLTRVFNKRYFVESLKKEFAFAVRHKVPLSLIMLDVDHFKKVNDTYGHLAGDTVLAQLAQVVRSTVRTEDLLARYGGEEFAIVLRDTGHVPALKCAERCRVATEKNTFNFNGTRIPVTISLGVSTLEDKEFATPDGMIEGADQFLYKAKQGGRNRTVTSKD